MPVWIFVVFFLDGEPKFHANYQPILMESMEVCLTNIPKAVSYFDDMGKAMNVPPRVVGCVEAETIQEVLEYAKTLKPGTDA
jgi:hypothetical protein